ncbi:hypothetical protein [Ruminococcus flavefaciens]|uniref:phage scaffolding protein n=1 Tax=Ruminococcus flavefaciens TaxID=1265 RepID=UPI0026ECC49F|nr:hypothetical protein [Ruminococcus flavefaciens]
MALTRKALKAMGLTDEQIDSVIDMHTESTDAIKADRDKYKEEAEKLPDVQRQLDEANSKIAAAEKDDYKGKYEAEKAAHDKLKTEVQTKETTAKKSTAFKAMLKEKGYSDNAITKITKYGGYVDGIELDEKGAIKESDKLLTSIESEWGEYKPTEKHVTHTPNVPNQQAGGESQKTSRAAQIWEQTMKSMYGDKAVNASNSNSNNSSGKES